MLIFIPILFLGLWNTVFSVQVNKAGGYRNLVIAVDPDVAVDDCRLFMTRIKDVTDNFSKSLWSRSHGKIFISNADVVVDEKIAEKCRIWQVGVGEKWSNADIQIVNDSYGEKYRTSSLVGRNHIKVNQPMGCGFPGDGIKMGSSLLKYMDKNSTVDLDVNSTNSEERKRHTAQEIGKLILSAWARYRWGVFGNFPEIENVESVRCDDESTDNSTECLNEIKSERQNLQDLICNKSILDVIRTHPDFIGENRRLNPVLNEYFGNNIDRQDRKINRASTHDSKAVSYRYIHTPPQSYIDNNTVSISKNNHLHYFGRRNNEKSQNLTLSTLQSERSSKIKANTYNNVINNNPSNSSAKNYNPGADNNNPDVNNNEKSVNNTRRKIGSDSVSKLIEFDGSNYRTAAFVGMLPNTQGSKSRKIQSRSSLKTAKSINTTRDGTQLKRDKKQKSKFSKNEKVLETRRLENFPDFVAPTVNFVTRPRSAVILSLDLSTPAVAQASVEWIRGGFLRWIFGLSDRVDVGVLAAYSNTSFPLSFAPLASGPSTVRQLEEMMTTLPAQHEVDDNVYGGLYCLECVISETEKILEKAEIALESGLLILTVCEPHISLQQRNFARNSRINIHTIVLCPYAPLMADQIADNQGSWALSTTPSDHRAGQRDDLMAEVQFGQLLNHIVEEVLLWPKDSRLHTILEENVTLREDDVERVGAYRRVKGFIENSKISGTSKKLIVLVSSSPAKIVELWSGQERITMHRDTTRRYWAILDNLSVKTNTIRYSLKYLSTSLDLPLSVSVGVYEKEKNSGYQIKLRTNTRVYKPFELGNYKPLELQNYDHLKVWAEVTKNGEIVQNADVSIEVTYTSGSVSSTYPLMLLDDGSTEPDMIPEDGIYTRYLTWTPGVGRYVITATASSNTETVSVPTFETNIGEVNTAHFGANTRQVGTNSQKSRTGHFSIKSSPITLIVQSLPSGDFYPPSRITDLRVFALEESLFNVTWSAPGGDLDQGSATRYELKMYSEKEALQESNFDDVGIEVYCLQDDEQVSAPVPELFGSPQFCITSVPFTNLYWYFAIRAVDGANNTGRISNIVSVFAPEPAKIPFANSSDTQTIMMSTVTPNKQPFENRAGMSWKAYGAAIIGAVGFVMASIVIFSCIVCCKRARMKALKDPERPIYKIYVNNAYIQEEDGEIKVLNKEKDHTQQWINSLDGQKTHDGVEIINDASQISSKFVKPTRFGVLTNGSIMREVLPSSNSSASSRPSEEPLHADFKYKDLSETISNSTSEGGATGSTASATDNNNVETFTIKEKPRPPPKGIKPPGHKYNSQTISNRGPAYPPLGIPTLPGPTVISIHSPNSKQEYNSDEEGGFKTRNKSCGPGPGPRKLLPPEFSSFRYLPSPDIVRSKNNRQECATISKTSKLSTTLPHGTVRSVKKRRHISFV